MIEGTVIVGADIVPDGATVEVTLADVTLEDASAPRLAATRLPWPNARTHALPFRLATTVDPARAYALAAQLRRGERLAAGDLVTRARRPWHPNERGPVELRLEPIG